MIDSGSQYDVINKAVWEESGCPNLQELLDKVVGANNVPLHVEGVWKTWVQLGRSKCESQFLVVKDLSVDCILGIPTQEKMGLAINVSNNQIHTKEGETIKMKHLVGGKVVNLVKEANLGSQLSADQKAELIQVIEKYPEVIVDELQPGRAMQGVEHTIPTGDARPIAVPLKRFSPKETNELMQQVKDLLSKGVIRPSHGPWSARAMIVPKKDGSGRMVVDYTLLNRVTKRDQFPLPNIDNMFGYLARAKYFTALDLAAGYHQFRVAEEDIEKTAFSTPDGLYEFVRMPMGLSNAPATFQRAMNKIFGDMIRKGVMVFIDDILIYSEGWKDHLRLVDTVLKRLDDHQLQVKASKCTWASDKTLYLGHVIQHGKKSPDPSKVQALKNLAVPKDKTQLRSFLGLAGYYREFICNYSHMTAPLTKLLKQDQPFVWEKEQEEAYQAIKETLCETSMLELPRDEWQWELHTDASTVALGAVLSQKDNQGHHHIIEYASQTLNAAQRNYSIPALECLAIVWALRKFRPYLHGTHFQVFTDHFGLKFLQSKKNPSAKLQRWWWEVSEYDFEVVYKKGELNIADPLSRLVADTPTQKMEDERNLVAAIEEEFEVERIIGKRLVEGKPEYLLKWKGYPASQASWTPLKWMNCDALVRKYEQGEEERRKDEEEARRTVDLPQPKELAKMQEEDPYVGKLIKIAKGELKPESIEEEEDAKLCVKCKDTWFIMEGERVRLIIPECLKSAILRAAHDLPLGGHMGQRRTHERIRERYWWRGMKKDVEKHIKQCGTCNSRARVTRRAPLASAERIGEPFYRIGIDFMTLPMTYQGNDHVVVIVDHASKWVEARACRGERAETVARALMDDIICRHGCPKEVWSDRGKAFINETVERLAKECGFHQKFTAGYHPETNGLVERMNRTLQEMLAKADPDQQNWDKHLSKVIWAYNTSKHSSTGYSPYEVIHGHPARLPEDATLLPEQPEKEVYELVELTKTSSQEVQAKALQNQQEAAQMQKQHHDKGIKEKSIAVGDMVRWYRGRTRTGHSSKLNRPWSGPWRVAKQVGEVDFKLENAQKQLQPRTAHVQDLMKVDEQFPGEEQSF